MFGKSAFGYLAYSIKNKLYSLNVFWRTELNTIDKLKNNLFISWVSENTDIDNCTVCYELYNGEDTQANAPVGEKAFKVTIIRNDAVRGRTEISYQHKPNVAGAGLEISIFGPTDVEYMHEWYNTLMDYIPQLLSKLQTVPDDAVVISYPAS